MKNNRIKKTRKTPKNETIKPVMGWAYIDKTTNKQLGWVMDTKSLDEFIERTVATGKDLERIKLRLKKEFKLIKVKITQVK